MPVTPQGIILPRAPARAPVPPSSAPISGPAGPLKILNIPGQGGRHAAPPPASRRRQAVRMPRVNRPRDWGYTSAIKGEDTVGTISWQDQLLDAADLALTKQIAQVVQAHYMGHPWKVEVYHRQGVAFISIPLFMGRYKYTLKLRDLKSDPGFRLVIRACGEILERYRIPRQKFAPDHFAAAVHQIPPWKRGRVGQIPA